ncbi:DUF2281 domain-containing protein [Pseudanabaenaceae cyanobacterium LEGE 13415]|nr:DUF2281 domain-containing protein [Pseudanabaenaceae cyanobacterium LEGE 13415]
MSPDLIAIAKLKALSPERQQEVLDFIEFLQQKDQSKTTDSSSNQTTSLDDAKSDWSSDPFFGIWRDRADLTDSSAWVKQIRQQHWNR